MFFGSWPHPRLAQVGPTFYLCPGPHSLQSNNQACHPLTVLPNLSGCGAAIVKTVTPVRQSVSCILPQGLAAQFLGPDPIDEAAKLEVGQALVFAINGFKCARHRLQN